MIQPGYACIVPGAKAHLTFVINDPSRHNLMALLVNASSLKTRSEKACLLYKGEHDYLTELSDIPYWGADLMHITAIAREIDLGKWQVVQPVTMDIVNRARRGARDSRQLKPDYLAYL